MGWNFVWRVIGVYRGMRFFLILFLCFGLLGCEEKSESVDQAINNTLVAEQTDDFETWGQSDYHPEKVFDDWLEWQVDSAAVCSELSKLSELDLTVFENQIRDAKYKKLLVTCQNSLIRRLDIYWTRERSTVVIPNLDFRLRSEALVMDTLPRTKILGQHLHRKQIILTFDDGPHPEYTEKILKMFKQTEVKALFFLLGKNVRSLPDKVFKIAAEGHSVGSHTDSHACIAQNKRCRNSNRLSSSQALNEIAKGARSVIDVLGWTHPFFRFPYGESSLEQQQYLYGKGFFDFYWSIDSEDWKKRGLNEFYQSLIAKIERNQVGNILFHDIQKRTLEVMPLLLKYLHKNDYTIVIVKAKPVSAF